MYREEKCSGVTGDMYMARKLQGILTVDSHSDGDLEDCSVKVMYKLVTFHIIYVL